MAFADQRCIDLARLFRSEVELSELVDVGPRRVADPDHGIGQRRRRQVDNALPALADHAVTVIAAGDRQTRSEEHTTELQSLMRISYAVFSLNKKNNKRT